MNSKIPQKIKLYTKLYLRMVLNCFLSKNQQKKNSEKIEKYIKKLDSLSLIINSNNKNENHTDNKNHIDLIWSYKNSNIIDKSCKHILIIGRDRTGDSIGVHSTSFLSTINFDNNSDIHFYDEYTKSLYQYHDNNKRTLISNIDITEIDGRFYDLLLFLNVLHQGGADKFESKSPHRMPLLSFCYCVFDGTVPPENWVKIINKYFDVLLVPVENLVKIFENNGVTKPVFSLAVAQDYSKFLNNPKSKNKIFRFGWSGYLEPRKNPIKILKTFESIFGGNKNVELIMHTRGYDPKSEYALAFLDLVKKASKNVKFIHKLLTREESITLINSFDCVIYPSTGEGFSNIPRESLAAGATVILSGIPTHKCITKLNENNGIYWLKADIEIPAIQPSLHNQVCGIMFDIHEEELKEKMLLAYKNRTIDFQEDKIITRKNIGSLYDLENLKSYYNSLVFPQKIELSDKNEILKDRILTKDENLRLKLSYYIPKSGLSITISPTNDAGFFSMFNQYVSFLAYAEKNEIIIPDWRLSTLLKNISFKFGRDYLESFCYGNLSDGNIFLKFFLPPFPQIKDEIYSTDLMYTVADKILEINDYNSQNEPNLTYIHSYKLYKDKEYFPIFRKKYNEIVKKYIKLRPHIQKQIDKFYETHMKSYFCISAHIRCSAHAIELPQGTPSPSFSLYDKKIREILINNNIPIKSDKWRLFIASDNEQSLNFFKTLYSNNTIFQNDIKRLSSKEKIEYQKQKEIIGHDFSGLELQHRCAKNDQLRNIKMGKDILTDAYLLAKANYFVFVNSNVSTAVSYINPKIKMIYCE